MVRDTGPQPHLGGPRDARRPAAHAGAKLGSHHQHRLESGHQPDTVKPHYNASKAALVNLTKGLSKAYGKEGILVNIVSPTTTITPAVEKIIAEEAESEATFVEENRPNMGFEYCWNGFTR